MNFRKEKKSFMVYWLFKITIRNKSGFGFDKNANKKVSLKTKLEDIFLKKRPSFKNSKEFKREDISNKSVSSYSQHSLN